MHAENLDRWSHSHRFETGGEGAAERRTRIVVILTFVVMIVEIAAGLAFNSMALLADGWHMATHAGALGIAAFAYSYARRHANDPRFAFGTGKVGSLAGFASAVALAMVAALLIWESATRLTSVQVIGFDEALPIAVLGLLTNLASVAILGGHGHTADHDEHGHGHHHHDHNLRGAYLHVVADALTSVTAIAALLLGKYFGWWWVDPLMGIAGGTVILVWAYGLMRQAGGTLIDMTDAGLRQEVVDAIEGDADNKVADLHLWRVGPGHWSAIVSLVTHHPRDLEHYRALLAPVHEISHLTVEVQSCQE
ncbi:CDF family Co(II)/Ni(II) efflux transporter DmeF [Emcibacter sp. SYSU 3D8]|uniref:CDF family Co(II)/Ni(II) efflux transporter DmeF n=1 Tax=Emcibacter sp. SYSU 3D8 TaxID=3133969 RepID=UPI0031FF4400